MSQRVRVFDSFKVRNRNKDWSEKDQKLVMMSILPLWILQFIVGRSKESISSKRINGYLSDKERNHRRARGYINKDELAMRRRKVTVPNRDIGLVITEAPERGKLNIKRKCNE